MKIAVIIDNDTTNIASRLLGFAIDWNRFRNRYVGAHEDTSLSFYATTAVNRDGVSPIRKLLDFIEYNGFRMRNYDYASDHGSAAVTARLKAVAAMTLEIKSAADAGADMIVLWSNEAALVDAVKAAQRAGAFVRVVSTLAQPGGSSKSLCSDDLRRAADVFEDMENLRAQIALPSKGAA